MTTFKNSSCFLPPLLLVNNFLFIYGVESIQIIHVNFQTSIGIIEKNRNVCRSHSHQIYFFLLNRLSKLHKNIIIFKFKTSIPIIEEVENLEAIKKTPAKEGSSKSHPLMGHGGPPTAPPSILYFSS